MIAGARSEPSGYPFRHGHWTGFTIETTAVPKSIMPLHVEPDTPVFTNVNGEPIEPKVWRREFSFHARRG